MQNSSFRWTEKNLRAVGGASEIAAIRTVHWFEPYKKEKQTISEEEICFQKSKTKHGHVLRKDNVATESGIVTFSCSKKSQKLSFAVRKLANRVSIFLN